MIKEEQFKESKTDKITKIYENIVNLLVILIIPLIIATLFMSLFTVLYAFINSVIVIYSEDFKRLLTGQGYIFNLKPHDEIISGLIRSILNFFVLVELFRIFLGVAHYKRIRKREVIEATMVYLVREIILFVFNEHVNIQEFFGFGFLILTLSISYVVVGRDYREFKFRKFKSMLKSKSFIKKDEKNL